MTAVGTIERAHGRWDIVLAAIGVPTRHLKDKHGPCPLCGGRDRYRWDNKDGSGSYYCNQCGAGSGMTLVQKYLKVDFPTACRRVDEIIGTDTMPPRKVVASKAEGADRRRASIQRTLDEADDDEVVAAVLRSRGLPVGRSTVLRGHPNLPYYTDDRRLVGRYPAMVVPILGADGTLQSAHRIYLTDAVPKRERKKLMPAVESITGGAARLFPAGERMAITEGVETGLAVHEIAAMPVWATISAGGMEAFDPPESVTELHIYGDNDASYTGQKAAYDLAQKLAKKRGIRVEVRIPPEPGTDWLDVFNSWSAGE